MRFSPDRALVTAILVLLADQASKWLAVEGIQPGETFNVLPGVSFNRVENTGIAFGTFAGRPGVVFALMGAALCVLLWFYFRHRHRPGLWLATGLLLGGALGNALDRIRLGHVRDFISLPHFPSFNVADVAITLGVVILALTIEQNQQAKSDGNEQRND